MSEGTIVQIIGPVVDADFSDSPELPKIFHALEIHYQENGTEKTLVLEVQDHMGDGRVRAIAMSSTEGLSVE